MGQSLPVLIVKAPAKRWQHFNATYRNTVGPLFCKPWLNDRNISMQHIATLLGATCCVRLATMLWYVVACCELKIELVCTFWHNIVAWTSPNYYNIMQHPQMLREKFDHFQIWANNIQHVATHRNMVAKQVQHVEPNSVGICCVEMLRSFGYPPGVYTTQNSLQTYT